MLVSYRLRSIHEAKGLSQGIEERTGMMRSYISWVENDHVVPAIESLEVCLGPRFPLYRLFDDGKQSPMVPKWGNSGKDARTLAKFRRLLS